MPDWMGTTGGSLKAAAAAIATKAATPSRNSDHPSGRNSATSPTTMPIATPTRRPKAWAAWLGNPGDKQMIALIAAKSGLE